MTAQVSPKTSSSISQWDFTIGEIWLIEDTSKTTQCISALAQLNYISLRDIVTVENENRNKQAFRFHILYVLNADLSRSEVVAQRHCDLIYTTHENMRMLTCQH